MTMFAKVLRRFSQAFRLRLESIEQRLSPEAIFRFGNGAFEFSQWQTPFENSRIAVLEVAYHSDISLPNQYQSGHQHQSFFKSSWEAKLEIRLYAYDGNCIYRVSFDAVSAFRVLDEHGLTQLWERTAELGGHPGQTTFKVRNHLWAEESLISFPGAQDGWLFVIASDWDCVKIVALTQSTILEEEAHLRDGAPNS